MEKLEVTKALADVMDDIIKTRDYFGESTQVSKLIEEIGELRVNLAGYLSMLKAGHNPPLAFSLTADEVADVLTVLFGLLARNSELDHAVSRRIHYKNYRTRVRVRDGYYGPDGKAKPKLSD
jgi:hypothetical protein